MTDQRDEPTDTPPEPPSPPQPVPARKKRGGWIVAAILALVLGVLVALYYMGIFDGGRRREEVPWNAAAAPEAEPVLPDNALAGNLSDNALTGNLTGEAPANNMAAAAAPTPQPGRVTAQWLAGNWGQYCPGSAREVLVFLPGGSYSGVGGIGSWTLTSNIVTLHINGRNLDMRWDYLTQDSARVTRQRTGQSYTLYRCL